jgi:hypothetical protein
MRTTFYMRARRRRRRFRRRCERRRARVVVGVVGLITFLLLTAPIEEVERRTKR